MTKQVDRQSEYGAWTTNAEATQAMLDALSDHTSYETMSATHKETIHMILNKISRMCCGNPNHIDNAVDIAGYATRLQEYIEDMINNEIS